MKRIKAALRSTGNPFRISERFASAEAIIAIRLYGLMAIGYGIFQTLGGPERWSATLFNTLSLMPGAPYTYAFVITILGVIILAGSYMKNHFIRNIGMYGAALWLLLFASCFIIAIVQDPHNSATAWIGYTALALHLVILARSREVTS